MADSNLQNVGPNSLKTGSGGITKNRFVKQDTSAAKQIVQSAAGTDRHMGVALETTLAGAQCTYQNFGRAKVEAGAAVAIGDQITADSVGRGVTVATGDRPGALALEAAGAAGEVIECELHGGPNLDGKTTP